MYIGIIHLGRVWWNGPPPKPTGIPAGVTLTNAITSQPNSASKASPSYKAGVAKSLIFDEISAINGLWRGASPNFLVDPDENRMIRVSLWLDVRT
jgi:hypothetical protein